MNKTFKLLQLLTISFPPEPSKNHVIHLENGILTISLSHKDSFYPVYLDDPNDLEVEPEVLVEAIKNLFVNAKVIKK